MPLFVRPGKNIRAAIPAMPGQFQLSLDQLVNECEELAGLRVPAVLLFGIPPAKDDKARGAYAKDGIIQDAVRAIKARAPELFVMTDVCLCEYMSHGHCGVVRMRGKGTSRHRPGHAPAGRETRVRGNTKKPQPNVRKVTYPAGLTERDCWIDNEATLELLAKTAVSHAQAGADLVAPSDMMDGNVGAIRGALDDAGYDRTPIMGYTAKYASNFYGPFRDAVGSAPAFGDRRSYQMDPANASEALREARLDIEQGADIIMVKPALAYLDIIRRVKDTFQHPVAAFNVSGEYAMVKAAGARGWLAERATWLELLLAMKRAGADLILTYWAKEAAKVLRERS